MDFLFTAPTWRFPGHGDASDARQACAVDPSHVRYRGERLAGDDAVTSVVDASSIGDADATDRVGRWSRGTRLPVVTPSTRSPSR